MAKVKAKKDSGNENGKQDKRANLKAAMKLIHKEYNVSINRLGDAPIVNVEVISTGVLSIDRALKAGGIPKGRITEFHGPEASGKSTIALLVAAEVQRNGGVVAWFDLENAFDADFAAFLGVNVKELLFTQDASAEDSFSAMIELIKNYVDLIVVDSVANLVPKDELESEMDSWQIGLQARVINKGLRKMTAIIASYGTSVVFINQLRMKIGVKYGNPEDTPGGKGLKFYASIRMRISTNKDSRIKRGENIIGHRGFVDVIKNRVGPPFGKGSYILIYGKGIDKETDICTVAQEEGIIASGGWPSYVSKKHKNGDTNIFKIQGLPNFIEAIRQRPEVLQEIRDCVMNKIREDNLKRGDGGLEENSSFLSSEVPEE